MDTIHTAFLFAPKGEARPHWTLVLRNGHGDTELKYGDMFEAHEYMAKHHPLWMWEESPILSSDFRGVYS